MELNQRKERLTSFSVKPAGTGKRSGVSGEVDFVWTVRQVVKATGGELLGGPGWLEFKDISIDSRSLREGDLFLALAGDNFDGHDFLEAALAKGAAGLVVSRSVRQDVDVPVIKVADTLEALGMLASYRRQLRPDLGVVAVTGSSGKTTVKEMCGQILLEEFGVLKTEGNLNNLVGLPLTLLKLDNSHDLAVLEMGMNHPGEIRRMAKIADPDIACIHNIQEAHLAGFDSIEGIGRAKEELFEGSSSETRLCVNYDDERVRTLARKYPQRQIAYGRHRKAEVRATHVRNLGEEGMAFTLHIGEEKRRLRLKFLGEHNVCNALAAAAVSCAAGLRIDQIARRLEQCLPYNQRFGVDRAGRGVKIVDDCYNANPSSMDAALNTLQSLRGNGKSVAVLGDMMELGELAEHAHLRLGEKVACLGFDFLIAVGEFSVKTVEGALNGGMTMKQVISTSSSDDALVRLDDLYRSGEIAGGDWILIKGSRGMKMETIVEGLKERLAE
ncbi:MAG: UDP-N-acetylmuramoyl-tripeptide--D-alanyl-D-alanine ligase [Desulfurivibrionaceae bacterium]